MQIVKLETKNRIKELNVVLRSFRKAFIVDTPPEETTCVAVQGSRCQLVRVQNPIFAFIHGIHELPLSDIQHWYTQLVQCRII